MFYEEQYLYHFYYNFTPPLSHFMTSFACIKEKKCGCYKQCLFISPHKLQNSNSHCFKSKFLGYDKHGKRYLEEYFFNLLNTE